MKLLRPAIMLMLLIAATPPGNARGAVTLLRLYDFDQFVATSYELDSFYQETDRSRSDESVQSLEELYHLKLKYAVLSSRLWRGEASLGVKAHQQFGDERIGGGNSDLNLNYDVNGVLFRTKPAPVSFYLGSNELRVNPAFGRSYDATNDYYGTSLTVKNVLFPVSVSQSHNVFQTSGQARDRRNTQDTIGVFTGHKSPGGMVSTTASLLNSHGVSEELSDPDAKQDHYQVSGSINNSILLGGQGNLSRVLNSSYLWSGEDGSTKAKDWSLQEGLDWGFGQALKLRATGSLSASEVGSQEREQQSVRATLEHQLLETITTTLSGEVSETQIDTGTQKVTAAGLLVGYNRNLPRDSSLQVSYGVNQSLNQSRNGSGLISYRDERLNASRAETDNYLSREDIDVSTVVVWNATRTVIYLPTTDYTVVPDGRRTRLVIETNGAITQGEPLSIDYTVRVNPEVEFETTVQTVQASLSLWQNYFLSGAWSSSVQKKLSGQDDVAPVGGQTSYSARLERIEPNYRAGVGYSKLDAPTLQLQKIEGFWRYNREFDRSAFSASISDILSMYEETVSAGVVTQGGNSNVLNASALYRRHLSESLKVTATGEYQSASGRSLSQHLISSWIRGTFSMPQMETDLNLKMDWHFYKDQYQRNFTARLDFKRFF